MAKTELKDYRQWFEDIRAQRLDELVNAVKQTPGFEAWAADYTPDALDSLGEWFAMHIETRARTDEELQEIAGRSAYQIDIPGYELTNCTFSLAMDIGMYISQVFLNNHASLSWNQRFGNKSDVDDGQPILEGFGAKSFNPVRMMVTLAYGVSSKQKTGRSLREIYDIWSRMVRA